MIHLQTILVVPTSVILETGDGDKDDNGPSGANVGIAVGVTALVLVLAGTGFGAWYYIRRRPFIYK
jgi:hypothetical protein